jgi:hypothetical protein
MIGLLIFAVIGMIVTLAGIYTSRHDYDVSVYTGEDDK